MSPVYLRVLGIPRNQPEKRKGLFECRRSGLLETHRAIASAPQTPQRPFPMEHGKQEVEPGFTLGRTWGKLLGNIFQRDILQRPYGNHQILESDQEVKTLRRERSQVKEE
ncbi:hypothetical protein O181_048091 [Austropuccinia psidii MF-1]|uniref:Uncharacterized protein n=1 Tax=Austropuccinia psidii MF-1 TaxID=1389203 RepID=A0A9Q3HK27_9BASI|nr:hypothetical protein [Austropuccinia psidii MF-1]